MLEKALQQALTQKRNRSISFHMKMCINYNNQHLSTKYRYMLNLIKFKEKTTTAYFYSYFVLERYSARFKGGNRVMSF
ncbi:hypothetical protein BY458DRAFT_496206 [Sporodiniella umbellata]|nr:hypothetical protein BY458DRAFT_496206 [Sporodiniella umbellata]